MARDIYEDADAVDAEPKGEGLSNALVIVTTILLLGALVVLGGSAAAPFIYTLF